VTTTSGPESAARHDYRALARDQITGVGQLGLALPKQQVTGRMPGRVQGLDHVAVAEIDRPALVDGLVDAKVHARGRLGMSEDRHAQTHAQLDGVADVIDVVVGDRNPDRRAPLGAQLLEQLVEARPLACVRRGRLDDQQAVAANDQRVRGRGRRQRGRVEDRPVSVVDAAANRWSSRSPFRAWRRSRLSELLVRSGGNRRGSRAAHPQHGT
jgi:hypothetical protein